jgi:hypothetical protein
MSNRYRRYSKRELLGSLHVDYVMSVTDLGLAPKAKGSRCHSGSRLGALVAAAP